MIDETNRLFVTFLWGGSTLRVAQKTMSLRKEHGYLELPYLDALIAGKKLIWIIRIYFSEPTKWNMSGKYFQRKVHRENGTEAFILKCSSLEELDLS